MSTLPMSETISLKQTTQTNPDLELVAKIIEKSEEGKLRWSRLGSVYKAKTPDGTLSVDLNVGNANPLFRVKWSEFSVRVNGEEIIKKTNDADPFAVLAGISSHQITSAIDELVSYLEGARRAEVKQALGILNRL